MRLLHRALTMPSFASESTFARAIFSGSGVRWFNSANGVTNGSPNAATKRPAMVVAAATVTCWPRMARRPSSKPWKAPGTRKPRLAFTKGPRNLFRARWREMISGRAFRSKRSRRRFNRDGSTGDRLCVNSNTRACLSLPCVTLIHPLLFPNCTVRA